MAKKNEENMIKDIVPVTETVPAYLQNYTGKGDEVQVKDLQLGYVKLIQPLSPEVSNGTAKPGDLVNSVSGVNYGTKVAFIPLGLVKNATRWMPREEGGGVDCKSNDLSSGNKHGECKKCVYSYDRFFTEKNDRQSQCVLYYNFPSLVNEEMLPISVTFEMNRSKRKAGSALMNIVGSNPNRLPLFCFRFILETYKDKKGNFEFFNVRIVGDGFVDSSKLQYVERLAKDLKAATIDVDVETVHE